MFHQGRNLQLARRLAIPAMVSAAIIRLLHECNELVGDENADGV